MHHLRVHQERQRNERLTAVNSEIRSLYICQGADFVSIISHCDKF